MLKRLVVLLSILAISLFGFSASSNAGLNAVIDLTNPRIVPMYVSNTVVPPNMAVDANYSGFLYSSRIVFSAAHSEYYFDNNGQKIDRAPKEIFVGKPNSQAGDLLGAVRVIKRFIAKNYRFDSATLGDFVVYVLEKDLVDIDEAKLLTPEIEKELIESETPIKMHGYGEYLDRCLPGEELPCTFKGKKTDLPRSLTSKLITLKTAEKIVGYERPQLSTSLIINNGKAGFGCGGDSGGSITASYKGELLYLATTPNGMNGYACGASGFYDGKGGINYSSAVYNHLDVISEAKEFLVGVIAEENRLREAEKAAKAEAEAKAAAELRAKQEVEEKAAAELKAKQEAEAKAKAEMAAKSKTTITCAKGKLIKKVTGANPKCPTGYKKK